jgi:type VI secretion system secreted protein Hcp
MAFEAFLKIDGIDGEGTKEGYEKQIEIISFSTGVTQRIGSRSDAGAPGGSGCDHMDFSISKFMDSTSPTLALYCSQGKNINSVVITLCASTGERAKYMEYTLTNVVISSYSTAGAAESSEGKPTEAVSFNYAKIEWTYTGMSPDTGVVGTPVIANWDKRIAKGA